MKPQILLLAAALLTPLAAFAGPGGPHDYRPGPPGPGFHPHGPARWYPDLPSRATTAVIAGVTYFVLDGVFHRRTHDGYVVVTAPPGAVVKVPPPGYRVVVIGPRTYYVSHDTWYRWDDDQVGYIVVDPPAGKATATASSEEQDGDATEKAGKLYVYPKGGQSDEQLARDRYECHQWAVQESGYDPSQGEPSTGGNADYRRAIGACLEARDYTVR